MQRVSVLLMKIMVVMVGVGVLLTPVSVEAAGQAKVNSKANIAIEMESGKILSAKNADEKLAIASVSKIVTMYMVLDKIGDNSSLWDEFVPINPYLIELSKEWALGSTVLDGSHQYTVRDLFYAMCIVSSNSATMALGDWVSADGSQSTYISEANDFIASLGITGHTYVSSSGLENIDIPKYIIDGSTIDDYNKFSAMDVSIIARELLIDFPEILEFANGASYTMSDGTTLLNNFSVLKGASQYDSSLNLDGLKTGFTYVAGFCFVGTEFNGEFRTISVVLDSQNYGMETNQLMRHARDNYKKVQVNIDEIYPELKVGVIGGEKDRVGIHSKDSSSLVVKKDGAELKVNAQLKRLNAPVKAGEELHFGEIYDSNDILGYVDEVRPTVTMITNEEIPFAVCVPPEISKPSDFFKLFDSSLLVMTQDTLSLEWPELPNDNPSFE